MDQLTTETIYHCARANYRQRTYEIKKCISLVV